MKIPNWIVLNHSWFSVYILASFRQLLAHKIHVIIALIFSYVFGINFSRFVGQSWSQKSPMNKCKNHVFGTLTLEPDRILLFSRCWMAGDPKRTRFGVNYGILCHYFVRFGIVLVAFWTPWMNCFHVAGLFGLFVLIQSFEGDSGI